MLRSNPFRRDAFEQQPLEVYSAAQVRSVEQDVRRHLASNPGGEVQVRVKYYDKDARQWTTREGAVTANDNNQLVFSGTDGANGDADEEPIQWPVRGARYGEIACRMVDQGIQQATDIARDGIQAATLLSANQQRLNFETTQALREQQEAIDRTREEHRETVRLTMEAMSKEKEKISADRASNNSTEAQLEARTAQLRSMEESLAKREKEFEFWMTEGNDQMLAAARALVEKEFKPPPTPLRVRQESAATQMTPNHQPVQQAPPARTTTTTSTFPEFRVPSFHKAPSVQSSTASAGRRSQQPNRQIVFDDPFDVDEEDEEDFEEEDDGFSRSQPTRDTVGSGGGDVAADSFAFDPRRWGGLDPVQQQSLLLYINQRTKTSKPAQAYLVEDLLRMVKGQLQLAEVSPSITKQKGFQTTATTIIKRLRMITMLAEGQSATFVGFFADEVSGAGQPDYLRQAERRAAKLAAAAASTKTIPGGGGGRGGGGGGKGEGKKGDRGRGR